MKKQRRHLHTRWGRLLRPLVLAAVIVVCVMAVIFIGRAKVATETLWEYEENLHAWLLVTDLLAEHVRETGLWPSDWGELERLPARDEGLYQWPADADELRGRISIRFGLPLHEVFVEEPAEFTAAVLNGRTYEGYRLQEIQGILEAVTEVRPDP